MYKTDPNHISKHVKKVLQFNARVILIALLFLNECLRHHSFVKFLIINQIIVVVNRHDRSRNGGKLCCVIGE